MKISKLISKMKTRVSACYSVTNNTNEKNEYGKKSRCFTLAALPVAAIMTCIGFTAAPQSAEAMSVHWSGVESIPTASDICIYQSLWVNNATFTDYKGVFTKNYVTNTDNGGTPGYCISAPAGSYSGICFTLKWSNVGYDKDGDAVDLLLTVKNITFDTIGTNSGHYTNAAVIVDACVRGGRGGVLACGSYSKDGHGGGLCGNVIEDLYFDVYKAGTNTAANGRWTMGINDLDYVPNRSHKYYEGVQILSGDNGNAYVESDCRLDSSKMGSGIFQPPYDIDDSTEKWNTGFSASWASTGSALRWWGSNGAQTAVLVTFKAVNVNSWTDTYGGSISPNGSRTYGWKATPTYTMTPDWGYKVSDVKVDGTSIGARGSYQFGALTSNHTISSSYVRCTGKICLTKKSADESISITSRYHLNGAVYGIYYDQACQNPVQYNGANLTITTNTSGYAETPKCLWYTGSTDGSTGTPGKVPDYYYVKELTPSVGYNVDPTPRAVQVTCETGNAVTSWEPPKYGWISVKKQSDVAWTSGNKCYSTANVRYECKGEVSGANRNYLTDASGWAEYQKVPLGDYYITEKNTATGYRPDTTTYHYDIAEHDQYVMHRPKCIPLIDLFPMKLVKYDDNDWSGTNGTNGTKLGTPQAGSVLTDAFYSIKYYDGYYDTVTATTSLAPTWTKFVSTQNDANNFASFTIPSAEMFPNSISDMGWPLGTYVVEETVAPNGYYLDAKDPYVFQIKKASDTTASNELKVGKTQTGATHMSNTNAMVSTDDLQRTDLKIIKTGADYTTSDKEPERTYNQQGVTFDIINMNTYRVWNVKDKVWVDNGDIVYTITTNASGEATTKDIATAAGYRNALPIGTYKIHESSNPNAGYKMSEDIIVTLTMPEDETPIDVENKQGTAIRITKAAADTHKTVKAPVSFSILDENKQVMTLANKKVFTADSSGVIIIPEKLMHGTYYIKEVKPPKGYTINNELLQFTIEDHPDRTSPQVNTFATPIDLTFENEVALSDADVYVIDAKTGENIVNTCDVIIMAAVDIYTGDGTLRLHAGDVIGTYPTVDGHFKVTGLYPGSYTATEVTTPNGYLPNANSLSLVVANTTEGLGGVVKIPNAQQTGGIQIQLNDRETNRPIQAPATFEIIPVYDDGNGNLVEGPRIEIVTTNEHGWASTTSNLDIGKYIVREIQAPDGYILDRTPIEANISYDPDSDIAGVAVIATNLPQKGSISVVKRDSQTGLVVAKSGAKFEIYAAKNIVTNDGTTRHLAGECVRSVESGDDGSAMGTELYIGEYYIKEIKAPVGYLVDRFTRVDATVKYQGDGSSEAAGTIVTADFYDDALGGKIKVTKVDSDSQQVVRNNHMKAAIKAKNDMYKSDGELLYNAGDIVCEIETNDSGVAETGTLPLGSYVVVESQAPTGYVLNETEYDVILTGNEENIEHLLENVKIEDVQQKGQITIHKVNAKTHNDIKLAGAQFAITAKEDVYNANGTLAYAKDTTCEIITSDANGIASSKALPFGAYNITELAAPEGYKINHDIVSVRLSSDDSGKAVAESVIFFEDDVKTNEVTVVKVDKDSDKPIPIRGVIIEVRADDDIITTDGQVIYKKGDLVGTVVTDDEGKAKIDNIPDGKYVLIEKKAPYGYVINPDPIPFETGGDNSSSEVKHPGVAQKGSIVVTKVETDGKTAIISDTAEFSIFAANDIYKGDKTLLFKKGALVCELVTDEEGKCTTDYLPLGEYLVQETKSPNGYVLQEKPAKAIIAYAGQDKQYANPTNVMFANEKKQEPAKPKPPIEDPTKPTPPVDSEVPPAVNDDGMANEYINTDAPQLKPVADTGTHIVSNAGDICIVGTVLISLVCIVAIAVFRRRR